ncbi:palmitoyltransferase ZDHHC6 isoform X1 [Protopterus annectens]|uniref:palmitoyltransferase ZDHHC6 isoform X1 n=1 Tax=Protopterus annectens TaxID=7888 RepID=UPI001CFAE787|nr:palmitoyltransferase ZDHHC6 isoform X1 [Protopterus annectens]XP_043911783.1 palmitoyltransferase ZDHHC6 isoform X1 [Protopterus annectens]XP_043911784.1 palmitoyltransferase ZDHHC6 isoform X1 [Protopterus annectens]
MHLLSQKMVVLCSIIRFENLHELKRLCHWGPVVAISVIIICSTMAVIDSILWYWPLDTPGGSINFIMLINWTVLILYNYFNAMFVGPGYIPLGWKPERTEDSKFLQFCRVCQGYKAARAHHCRKCNRCVMKMDHHCPWINNCCGHHNHAYFTLFLLLAPLGCIHAAFIFIMTMYTQLHDRISFAWSAVRIDMSSAKRDPRALVQFGMPAFAASLFALGLALGTTIAVGMLFVIQMKVILRNKTSIESWIEEKAKDRIQYYQTGEHYIFPYDLGSKWANFKQVFTWSGVPEGNGTDWLVKEGCHPYALTIEQLKQKADKRVRSVQYRVIENYNGACCPLTKGIRTFFTAPCTEEPRIKLCRGEVILATRGLKHWMYGDKILNEEQVKAGIRIRGWFPRRCVEKCLYDTATGQPAEEKKEQ